MALARPKQNHINWSATWLNLVDKQGDRVGEWVEQGIGRAFRCLCHRPLGVTRYGC